ncbi:MAG: maleylpyruvate isomerase family mycothiol-dependent enzyme [Actinomycetota bacterium]|nr:maleylpyruvate isomerase family mycothiol-dependent enzyme [Actinomycetota bacterium]
MDVTVDQLGPPVDLRGVFAPQRETLLAFLRSLDSADWARPTACDGWDVADLVAHVLGDVVGRISGARDGGFRAAPRTGEALPTFIDRVNGEWVTGCRRLSPQLLVEMLEAAGPAHDAVWAGQPLDAPSLGVSWAGVDPAPAWFDAARDVTEYWVHERQLRDAVGAEPGGLPDLGTVLDVFARGLPHALARSTVDAEVITVAAEPPGVSWTLVRDGSRWSMADHPVAAGATVVTFDGGQLWRRWTRQPGSTPGAERGGSPIERTVLDHVAIVHSAPDA